MRHKIIILIIILITINISCVKIPLNKNYEGPKKLPFQINKYEECRIKGIKNIEENDLLKFGDINIKRITFPSCTGQYTTIDYFRSDKFIGRLPVIIILPILSGQTTISDVMSIFFTTNGYATIIVHQQYIPDFEVLDVDELSSKIDNALENMIINSEQIIDWIEMQKDIDSNQIGIFGISMGGINASLISAIDKRIKISVIALAGGDIPYILSYSKEKGIQKRREAFLKLINISQDELYNQMSNMIKYDPINFVSYMDARTTYMVLALFDKDVPYVKGKELREAMGGPETMLLFSTHTMSISFIFHVEEYALEVFNKNFRHENIK